MKFNLEINTISGSQNFILKYLKTIYYKNLIKKFYKNLTKLKNLIKILIQAKNIIKFANIIKFKNFKRFQFYNF